MKLYPGAIITNGTSTIEIIDEYYFKWLRCDNYDIQGTTIKETYSHWTWNYKATGWIICEESIIDKILIKYSYGDNSEV